MTANDCETNKNIITSQMAMFSEDNLKTWSFSHFLFVTLHPKKI